MDVQGPPLHRRRATKEIPIMHDTTSDTCSMLEQQTFKSALHRRKRPPKPLLAGSNVPATKSMKEAVPSPHWFQQDGNTGSPRTFRSHAPSPLNVPTPPVGVSRASWNIVSQMTSEPLTETTFVVMDEATGGW